MNKVKDDSVETTTGSPESVSVSVSVSVSKSTSTSTPQQTVAISDGPDPATQPAIHNVFADTQSSAEPSAAAQRSTLNRRRFMQGVGTVGMAAVGTASLGLAGCADDDDNVFNDASDAIRFDHGVASGDPLADRVILWTRVTPQALGSQQVTVQWHIATDPEMQALRQQGSVTTSAAKDYTVKVDASGLEPDTLYYYQFSVGDRRSRIGTTKTLPVGQVSQVTLAVFSCANYPAGYFHAYADAAKRRDLDVVIHLGDYLYEYGRTVVDALGNTVPAYASADAASIDREVEPAQELIGVNDYRKRYAQYRTDPDLQDLHAALPMIAVWDDHELSNDAFVEGAQNHQPATEGSWDARKLAAVTAYHEWMPIRSEVQSQIYRRFDFGDLLSLSMLDTRVIGRDIQLDYSNFVAVDSTGSPYIDAASVTKAANDSSRQLLGLSQRNWLVAHFEQSEAIWQMLGQQVLMGRMLIPAPVILNLANPAAGLSISAYLALVQKAQANPQALTAQEAAWLREPAIPYNTDAWDGYGAAREAILTAANTLNKNLVVLSGDTHNAWANNLTTQEGVPVGVEFATSSVTSPGFEAYLPDIAPATLQAVLTQLIADLQYMNPNERGYMVITVTPEVCQSDWVFVSDVRQQTYSSRIGQTLRVEAGQHTLSTSAGQAVTST